MINVMNDFNGITNVQSDETETQQSPTAADLKAFQKVMSQESARERAAQMRWQENAGPLNERLRSDASPKTERQASIDSLFSMSGKTETTTFARTNAPQGEASKQSMHDLETGALKTGESGTETQQTSMKGSDFIDALFRNATSTGMNVSTNATAQVAESQGASMPDGETLEALVSRILVNTPEKGGSEVRLTLSEAAFRGTEVSILRDTTGALTVKIVSSDPSAFQTLVSSRNELLSALQAEEKAPVTVNMEEEKPDAQENDTHRRSRGLDQLDDDVR